MQETEIQGLNTGGMGTFSPSPFYTAEVDEFCEEIYISAYSGCYESRRKRFQGNYFLWTDADSRTAQRYLEYNARFGDPEAQVVLPRMKNDIIDVVEACIDGTLDQMDLQFEDNAAVCVVSGI